MNPDELDDYEGIPSEDTDFLEPGTPELFDADFEEFDDGEQYDPDFEDDMPVAEDEDYDDIDWDEVYGV